MSNPIINYLLKNQILATLLVVVTIWLAFELSQILIIIFISYIVMASLVPFTQILEKKGLPKIVSVLIPYTLTIAILVLLIFPLIPFFTSQIQLLFKTFPRYAEQSAQLFNIEIDSKSISKIFESDINTIGRNALSFTGKIFSGVFAVLAGFVISFYLMLERDRLVKDFISYFPKKYQPKGLETIEQVEKKLGAWLRGQLILSLAVGATTWIALTLLGIPFALPLALLAGILEIVPTVGPIISAIPAVMVALSISPTLAIIVVILYIVIQMLENNVLVPKIMQKIVGLNPIVIILGVLIGSKFLGIPGALLSVPFIAMITILLKNLKPSS